MSTHTFIVNGTQVSVDVEDDVRLLWVLRDLLGITGPKYGCGLAVCEACTSHINGHAFNPCAVPVGALKATDEILTIEGLADTVEGDLHPVQQAWLDHDVAQCGFCQPGQIMTTVALINRVLAEGRTVTDADLDSLKNVCRCGTYPRVRAAVMTAAASMAAMAAAEATGPVPAGPAAEVAAAHAANERVVVDAASADRLPATGGTSLLGPAAAAAGAAVVIRSVADRAGRAAPASAEAPVPPDPPA
jgi:isoquinoline 1-oxidoreductase alpha subunit